MTRQELEGYAERLRATGLSFARGERDGSGNLQRLVDVPWDAAIVKVMQLTQWRVVDSEGAEVDVVPLRLEP